MGGRGVTGCLEWASMIFQSGDTLVSVGDRRSRDGRGNTIVAGQMYGGGAKRAQGSVPLSVLKRVATDIKRSEVKSYIESAESDVEIPTPESGEKVAGKDNTIYYVIGGVIVILGITYMVTRKQ